MIDQQGSQHTAHNGETGDCGDDLVALSAGLLLLEATLLLALVFLARDLAFPLVAA